MNIFNITGTVKSFGEKGSQYKTLWVNIEISNKDKAASNVFVQFPLDSNPGSKKAKLGEYIKSQLTKGMQIFISDITMKPIKFSKKIGEEWVQEERIGLQGNLSKVKLGGNSIAVNLALVEGKVIKHNDSKVVIEQSYRLPIDNSWKTRLIPVKIDQPIEYLYPGNNLMGKDAFIIGEVVGADPSVYMLAKNIIAT